MKYLVFIFCSFITFQAEAQIGTDFEKRNSKRQKNPMSEEKSWGYLLWSENASHYRPIGWHVSLGATYMAGNNANDEGQELTPTGLPGYYLEGGMEHLFKKRQPFVHYFDWGVGIKHFGGQEKYKLDTLQDRGSFNFGSAFLRAAIHNVWQTAKFNFIDQSIGFNLDYRIYGGKDKQMDQDGDYQSPLPSDNQSKLVAQLHYSLGWGIKIRDGLFLVPTVQTPVLTLFQFNNFNPSHKWFNSRYQPVIFTLKLAWLWPKSGCPKVFSVDGQTQSDQYQRQ